MTTTPYLNAQAVFYQQYEHVRRDEVVGILLALFLGGFGIHHFYLRRTGLGILYACFCWTPFPWVMGFIECFFMPGRVREFNAIQAAGIAAALGISMPAYGQPDECDGECAACSGCGRSCQARETLLRRRVHWWRARNAARRTRLERSFARGAAARFNREIKTAALRGDRFMSPRSPLLFEA